MTRPTWLFEPTPRMGGATGEAFTNPLHATGMTAPNVLAREAIQNSVDAKLSDADKVRIVFRRVTLSGQQKLDFIAALGLDGELVARKRVLELQQLHCLDSLDDSNAPLRLLYVEDYFTHGLYGAHDDPDSHFFRLLLALGDSAKSRGDSSSGGSYGYGKSVYSANSRVHTIVAYSRFDPGTTGHYARMMGCGYYNAHKFRSMNYSGRAWFGVRETADESQAIVSPLHDEEADAAARELGFALRDDETKRGTSILIVDTDVDCDHLRASTEDWWWPRILDESVGLDVALYEQGERVAPPRPRMRQDLKPFIHCFEMAIGRSGSAGKNDKTGHLNTLADIGISPGAFGYTVFDEDNGLDDEVTRERNGRIALIRSPRMVVAYMEVGGNLPLPCVGAFVANPKVDKALKISEPAAHDKWDPNSTRLNNHLPEFRKTVKAVVDRLKAGLRRFSAEAAPPAPKQESRLKSLERLLGNMFKPPTKGGSPNGGHPAAPIEIKFLEQPRPVAERGGLSTRGMFRLSLADHADKSQIMARLNVQCLVVEDLGSTSSEDPVRVQLRSDDVTLDATEESPGEMLFKLDKDVHPVFTFFTDKYEQDWTTHVRINVEEVE